MQPEKVAPPASDPTPTPDVPVQVAPATLPPPPPYESFPDAQPRDVVSLASTKPGQAVTQVVAESEITATQKEETPKEDKPVEDEVDAGDSISEAPSVVAPQATNPYWKFLGTNCGA